MGHLKYKASNGHLLHNSGGHLIETCGPVTEDCCADTIPPTLTATWTATGCTGYTTGTVTLSWNGTKWTGSATVLGATNYALELECDGASATDWNLQEERENCYGPANDPSPSSGSCNPLIVTFDAHSVNGDDQCGCAEGDTPTIQWTITE